MYGITETTVNVTYYPLTMADTEARTSPIGTAIPDLQVFVLIATSIPFRSASPGRFMSPARVWGGDI